MARRVPLVTGHHDDAAMRAAFDDGAATYDDWWLGTGRFAGVARPGWAEEVEQLAAVLHGLPPGRVLDVACGTGFLTRHLRGDVVALDQSARMVEIAAERLPHAKVIQGDIDPLPFDDGAFDRVVTSHFLHHLPSERRTAFVAEAQRVGGELVVVEDIQQAPAHGHGQHRHAYTAEGLVAELGGGRVLHQGTWFVVVAAH